MHWPWSFHVDHSHNKCPTWSSNRNPVRLEIHLVCSSLSTRHSIMLLRKISFMWQEFKLFLAKACEHEIWKCLQTVHVILCSQAFFCKFRSDWKTVWILCETWFWPLAEHLLAFSVSSATSTLCISVPQFVPLSSPDLCGQISAPHGWGQSSGSTHNGSQLCVTSLGREPASSSLTASHPGYVCHDHLQPLSLTCTSKLCLAACGFCVLVAFGLVKSFWLLAAWSDTTDSRNNLCSRWLILDFSICDRCSTAPDFCYFSLINSLRLSMRLSAMSFQSVQEV